jgi:hypothetical protein
MVRKRGSAERPIFSENPVATEAKTDVDITELLLRKM